MYVLDSELPVHTEEGALGVTKVSSMKPSDQFLKVVQNACNMLEAITSR